MFLVLTLDERTQIKMFATIAVVPWSPMLRWSKLRDARAFAIHCKGCHYGVVPETAWIFPYWCRSQRSPLDVYCRSFRKISHLSSLFTFYFCATFHGVRAHLSQFYLTISYLCFVVNYTAIAMNRLALATTFHGICKATKQCHGLPMRLEPINLTE